jgi:hypothetical protein
MKLSRENLLDLITTTRYSRDEFVLAFYKPDSSYFQARALEEFERLAGLVDQVRASQLYRLAQQEIATAQFEEV